MHRHVDNICLLILAACALIFAHSVTASIVAARNFMESGLVMYRTTAHTTADACGIIDKLWQETTAQEQK